LRAFLYKLDSASRRGKQGVIFTNANIISRVKLGSTLTNDNATGID
jgi:hypothetical protein